MAFNNTNRPLLFRESFWFLPAVYNAVALAIAAITVSIDYVLTPKMAVAEVILIPIGLSIEILSTLAGAILTMTAITFSSIMVVLSTYSAQFSPRVLQNFISDRSTQHVLALFSSGFTYSIVTLLFMNKTKTEHVFVTPAIAVIWGFAAIGAFVFLIHHTAMWMQVNNLIGYLAERTEKTIERVMQREVHKQRAPHSDADEAALDPERGRPIPAPMSGYVILVLLDQLFKHAREAGEKVRIEVHIGEYVMEGQRIMTVWREGEGEVNETAYRDCVQFGDEQKDWQDIAFGVRKLVEIAVRAISPAVNDPYTAAACVKRMAPILGMLAHQDQRASALRDDDGNLRVVTKDFSFEDYLFWAFPEIRHYGKNDLTVISSIIETLTLVARDCPGKFHDTLWRYGFNTGRIFFADREVADAERDFLLGRIKMLAAVTGHEDRYDESEFS